MSTLEIAKLVDALGDVNKTLTSYDNLVQRRDALRKTLAEYCDTLGPTDQTLTGERYSIAFSKPIVSRSIDDVAGYLEAVGLTNFLQSVKVSITSASKFLSKTDATRLFVESQGPRRLKAVIELPLTTNEQDKAAERFLASLSGILGEGVTQAKRHGSL